MPVKASLKHLHISPRKARSVVNVVRGMDVIEAENQLNFLDKGAARPMSKLLKSVVNNALHNHDMEKDNLYIKKLFVDEAPTLKRWRPRAYGRAFTIFKRTCHVNIELEEKVKGKKKAKKKALKKKDSVQAGDDKAAKKGKTDKPWEKGDGKGKGFFGKKVGDVKGKLFRRKSI